MRLLALPVAVGLLLAAAAPAPQTAERFVRMLSANNADDRLTMSGWTWRRYLSSRTAALQRRYESARSGDAGRYLDYDWLCQCQDSGGFRIVSIATAPGPRGTTVITVRFGRNSGVRLVLVNEHGWKIDDIIDARGMRYSAALQYNIRRAGR